MGLRFKIFLEGLQKLLYINNKYKIKLISMLCVVFGLFLYVLTLVINSNTIGVLDPLLFQIDENSVLGKIVSNTAFEYGAHFLLGRWNFGPSYETLLGLIILAFFILIVLIILSSYIKIFLIPLSLLTTAIFYGIYKTYKNNYYMENATEIFSKWGLTLKKNPEIIYEELAKKGITEGNIDLSINQVYDTYIIILNKQKRIYDTSNIDLIQLKKNILESSVDITSQNSLNEYILKYINDNMYLEPLANKIITASNSTTSNAIPYMDLLNFGGSSSTYIFIGIGTIVAGALFLYFFSESILNYVNGVDKRLSAHIDKTDAQGEVCDAIIGQADTQGDLVSNVKDNLLDSMNETTKLTEITKQLAELQKSSLQNSATTVDVINMLNVNNVNCFKAVNALKNDIDVNLNDIDVQLTGIIDTINDLAVNNDLIGESLNESIVDTQLIKSIFMNQNLEEKLQFSYKEVLSFINIHEDILSGNGNLSEIFISKIIEGIEKHQNSV